MCPVERFSYVNAGVNSNCAWNMRERLGQVLRCRPTIVTIMAGTNDIKGVYNATWGEESIKTQKLPEQPSAAFHVRALAGMIDDIRTALPETVVLVCELPPFGEDWTGREQNFVRAANTAIRRLVQERGEPNKVRLVEIFGPLEARAKEMQRADGDAPPDAFDGVSAPDKGLRGYFGFDRMEACIIRRYGFGQPWDLIGRQYGYRVMSDGLHLNDQGALVVAEQIASAVRETL